MALPLNLLNSFFPMTLRACTTSGAKGPVAPLLPIRVTSRWGLPAAHSEVHRSGSAVTKLPVIIAHAAARLSAPCAPVAALVTAVAVAEYVQATWLKLWLRSCASKLMWLVSRVLCGGCEEDAVASLHT